MWCFEDGKRLGLSNGGGEYPFLNISLDVSH